MTADPLDAGSTTGLFRLDGRVAVITGGAGMLARQFGEAIRDFGGQVVLADVNAPACQAQAAAISAAGDPPVLGLACDVADPASWKQLIEDVLSRFGRIDILVNNAALTNASRSPAYGAEFADYPLEDWNRLLAVNLTGSFLGCQLVGQHMLSRRSGSIINIASQYGVVSPNHRIYDGTGVKQPPAYSVSKAGVIALTRYLAALWADQGVRVNSISPGGVFDGHTDPFLERYRRLSPTGRMADRTEMRGALVYLASDASAYTTGHNLVVDGGWTAW